MGQDRVDGVLRRALAAPAPRIVALSGVLLAAAALLWSLPLARTQPPPDTTWLSWWGMAATALVCELVVLHLQVRREAHAISLGELASVVGLFLAGPAAFVLGRTAGCALIFIGWRRQPPVKALFNCSLYLAESVLLELVFHAVRGSDAQVDPRGWLAALVATSVAGVVSAIAVTAVIAVVDGQPRRRDFVTEPARGILTSAGVTCVALVAVHALDGDPLAAIPLAASLSLLLLGYRAYSGLSERHLSLERLYRFSNVVSSTPQVDQILREVLRHAREVLRAEHAEVVFVSSQPGQSPVRVDSDAAGQLRRVRLSEPEAADPVWNRVVEGGSSLLVPRGIRDPGLRAFLASGELRDAVLAPLRGEAGIVGTILVGNRLGEVRTFDADDLQLLETVANHAGMAMQNGQLVDRLKHDALHDALTGLPNRSMLTRALTEALGEVRAGGTPGLALMVVDLVGFKQVNDTLGPGPGDQVLREIAVRIAAQVQEEMDAGHADDRLSIAARLGGDEFALLLVGVSEPDAAREAALRLQATLERPVRIDGIDVGIGISLGVCLAPEHGRDGAALFKHVNAAMYQAKHTGVGLLVYEPGMDGDSDPERLALVGELRQGIQDGDLEVHVQPQASLRRGEIIGVEALVRWRHPRHGLLFPDEFIPLAERSGLIRPLTIAVLEQAVAACGLWLRSGRTLSVAVNLSARSLEADLIESVERLLAIHRVPAQALTLEITESSVISDPVRVTEVLERLHALGIRLSIDDFGTGYSSLSYLRQLPVQEVKVDKSFVMTMRQQQDDATIVRSIVDLAANLGLSVVAEGVEDAATCEDLAAMGCDLIQGYFLARPMPLRDFEVWLTEHAGRLVTSGLT